MAQHKTAQSKPQARWIDGHCHLADPRFSTRLDAQLEEARRLGIHGWVQGGVDPADWDRQVGLKDRLGPAVVLAFGLHPWWVANQEAAEVEAAFRQLESRLPVASALGELGLDLHPRHCPKDSLARQSWALEHQLELVKRIPKPLILHVVSAHGEALEILSRHHPFPRGGLVHSFGGSAEVAKAYLDLGFHLSIGGSVTREGSQKLKKAVVSVPLDRLVLETDAPDQTPELPGVDRGSLNEPRHLIGIAQTVARLREMNPEALLDRSTENLKRLFGI